MPEASQAPAQKSGHIQPQTRTLDQVIVSQLETLQLHHAAVINSDDVEAIHKMRVTTRRLQASLDLLQIGDKAAKIKRIKRQLRNWRRLLSAVRNYDVFLIMVEQETQSRRSSRREEFELLRATLQERRRKRALKIKKQLLRIDVPGLAARLGVNLPSMSIEAATTEATASSTPASTVAEVADKTAESTAIASTVSHIQAATESDSPFTNRFVEAAKVAERAAARLEQRLAEFSLLAAQSHPTTDPQELHQLRIAAKRLRYLLETTSASGFGSAVAALRYLRSLQDKIGDWHDLVALESEIVGIVSRRKFVAANLVHSSHMLRAATHIEKKKELLVSKLFPVKVPKTVAITSQRLIRSIRRRHRVKRLGIIATSSN
jgi:CHAD domain-containing protein